jgi:phosphomannomutase
MAERKLFGTDGVRGAVGEVLTEELAMRLGAAAVRSAESDRPQVLIVRDTRESGPMLESALAAGIASAGGDATVAGVLPTPAASVLARRLDFDLAAVVSASHNPWRDNGIKFLSRSGAKLGDEAEAAIEAALDGEGTVRDGDELIALAARHLDDGGELDGGVAVTVMTNYGFHQALGADGIEIVETDVGDRYVSEALAKRGWNLGGEQSGHIIWTDFAPTGDGIAAALLTMRALGRRTLAEVEPFRRLPQLLENIEVADRGAIAGADALWSAVADENSKLEGRGRVLVRPSGTEPLLRVMVEAPTDEECEAVLTRLVEAARRELT